MQVETVPQRTMLLTIPTPFGTDRNRLKLISGLLLLVLSAGCRNPSAGLICPDFLRVTPLIDPVFFRDGQWFFPAGEPVPIRISWPVEKTLPADSGWVITLVNHRNEILYRTLLDPEITVINGLKQFVRIIRIPVLLEARRVRIYVCVTDRCGAEIPDRVGFEALRNHAPVLQAYGIIRDIRPEFTTGWYPEEKGDGGESIRWCMGEGECCVIRPSRPVFFSFRIAAPILCFPERSWQFTLTRDERTIVRETVGETAFIRNIILEPHPVFTPSPIRFRFSSDRAFVPEQCQGNADGRNLSFQISRCRLQDFLPLTGFDLDAGSDSCAWIRPVAEAVLPYPRADSVLYVQGCIPTACVGGSQKLRLTLGEGIESERTFINRDFCWPISLPVSTFGPVNAINLKFHCSPFFFPVECGTGDDDRPHGIGISEIAVL